MLQQIFVNEVNVGETFSLQENTYESHPLLMLNQSNDWVRLISKKLFSQGLECKRYIWACIKSGELSWGYESDPSGTSMLLVWVKR